MSPLQNKLTNDKRALLKYCFISGVMAFGIMVFTYLCHSNSLLFGDKTVLRMDLYHQYGPLYAELYDRIVNGYSLVYSWTSGLGGGFLGNLFNYCCSPFALLILLLGHKNMPEAIALMILGKAVVSSVSFTCYINKSNRRNDLISAAFGVMYAFCGFFVAYSWNIMWLDAMSVYPLVLLGIERIIEGKKPWTFVFALTYTMITNYYMAYMVCILSVLHFFYYYFGNDFSGARSAKKTRVKKDRPAPQPAVSEPAPVEAVVSEPTPVEAAVSEPAPVFSEAAEPEGESGFSFDPIAIDDAAPARAASARETAQAGFTVTLGGGDAEKNAFTVSPMPARVREKALKKQTRGEGAVRRFLRVGFIFAGAAILSAMLSAFALLPVKYCLDTSSATSSSFPETVKVYFNTFDFVANHLPALETTIRSSGDVVLPNVYCGLLTVLLLPFFFMSSGVRGRKKVAAACMLGVFYVGFVINFLNYIWHGFHFPNDLPYRYSFAYSFLLLTLAYEALLHISEFTRKQFIAAGVGVLAFAVLVDKLGSKNVDNFTIVLTIVLAVVYVIVGGVFTSPRYKKEAVQKLLVFFLIVEICFANTGNYLMSQPKSNYTADYDSYQEIAELSQRNDTELFYRTELTKLRARMDPCWYGYNGVSTFSSMAYEHTSHMMNTLGMFSNDINSYTYYPQTPIFNSMFSLKYLYDNSDMLSDGKLYSFIASNDDFDAYENRYYLPLAFSVADTVRNWNTAYSSPFDVQNDLMAVCTGIGDCLVEVPASRCDSSNTDPVSLDSVNSGVTFAAYKGAGSSDPTVTVYIDVETEGEYYVYAGSTRLSSIKITADDFNYDYYSSSIQPFILDVGYQKAGSVIAVEYRLDKEYSSATISFTAARLDLNRFRTAYNKIKKNGTIGLTSFNETEFEGTINVTNENGFLFTSIPYDESWEVTVDGRVLEYYNEKNGGDDRGMIVKVGGGLMGFDLAKGEHRLTFRYRAKGLSEGLLLTLIGLAVLLIALLVGFVKKRKAKKDAPAGAPEQPEAPATGQDAPAPQPEEAAHPAAEPEPEPQPEPAPEAQPEQPAVEPPHADAPES